MTNWDIFLHIHYEKPFLKIFQAFSGQNANFVMGGDSGHCIFSSIQVIPIPIPASFDNQKYPPRVAGRGYNNPPLRTIDIFWYSQQYRFWLWIYLSPYDNVSSFLYHTNNMILFYLRCLFDPHNPHPFLFNAKAFKSHYLST